MKKLSAKEKQIKGTFRADRHKEMVPVTFGRLFEVPKPPEWLNEIGKTYFKELASILFEASVLQSSDLHVLALLCGELSRYRLAYTELEKTGQVVRLKNGYDKASEYIRIAEKAYSGACELASKFGLDLQGRSKIPAMQQQPRLEWLSVLTQYDGQYFERNFGHLNNICLHELAKSLEDYALGREKKHHDVEYVFR